MFKARTVLSTLSLIVFLAACGGGGGSDDKDSSSGNQARSGENSGDGKTPTTPTPDSSGGSGSPPSGGDTPPSGGGSGGADNPPTTGGGRSDTPSTPTPSVLSATVTQAPEDGARYLSGTVRLEVQGSGMRNVELLAETGYVPRLGSFNVSADGTSAHFDLNTRLIPNGGIKLRISAFDKPAGTSGTREVVAMPARTWIVGNPEGAINSGEGSPEARAIGCLSLGFPYTSLDDPRPVVCIQQPIPEQCHDEYGTFARPGDGRTVFRNGSLVPVSYTCNPAAYENGQLPPSCTCTR